MGQGKREIERQTEAKIDRLVSTPATKRRIKGKSTARSRILGSDRQADHKTGRQTDRETVRQSNRQTDIQSDRQTYIHTDRQRSKQTERQK